MWKEGRHVSEHILDGAVRIACRETARELITPLAYWEVSPLHIGILPHRLRFLGRTIGLNPTTKQTLMSVIVWQDLS